MDVAAGVKKVNNSDQVPIDLNTSSKFGVYQKISVEKVYNLFASDEWMINYAGFVAVSILLSSGQGRGLFISIRGGFIIAVVASSVFRLSTSLAPQLVGTIATSTGEVSIDENLNQQIAIADGEYLYIYSYLTGDLTQQAITYTPAVGSPYTIRPNYVTYHNTFFLLGSNPVSTNPQLWYAATFDTDDTVQVATQDAFTMQTKPDFALAVVRLPGRGNNVLVFGSAVAEVWTQVGGTENYKRIQSFNIDQGCVSTDTISASESYVCWLGKNETNSPAINVTDGASVKQISGDGIDALMGSIVRPDLSTAFFYRQNGHLFYQLTFYDPADNLTLTYDFNTEKFYHVCDENMNYHPARQIVYFNEKTYFVSLNTGALYEMSTNHYNYVYTTDPLDEGEVVPRIIVCKTVRREDNSRFRVGYFSFWLEQGVNDFFDNSTGIFCTGELITEDTGEPIVEEDGVTTLLAEDGYCISTLDGPRVDMSFSKDGNQSFSNIVSRPLNPNGVYRNQIRWDRMGQCNEFTIQLRFWSNSGGQRWCIGGGILEISS